MKTFVIAAAALGILAAAPASAQEFRLRAGPDGVTIRNDDDRGYRGGRRFDDGRFEERRVYRDDRRVYRRPDREECRIVTTRRERWDGSMVVRRERVCG